LQNEKFDVITAPNGAEALRLAYREHPNLVVLDVMMPGMDGFEVTSRLREMSDIPIILLTGKATEADKLRGFRLGVDDYITKPFSFIELAMRIQAVLSRIARKGEVRNVLPIGDLSLDLDKRELRRGEQLIALTPTEYRLLEVLAQSQGSAVSEDDLVNQVWGANRLEGPTSVRRYVWLLRQKVEPDPTEPRWIVTVRGFGYRLDL
jgi:DNA-binding response OmpR family regulator